MSLNFKNKIISESSPDIMEYLIRKLESKEKDVQNTIINIKNKYGKNAIVKGLDLLDGATTIDRNNQVGGHRAWIIMMIL